MKTCLNCHQHYLESYKFCHTCGQKASVHRINTHFLIHAFTHADTGIFYLVKELALKPGVVVKEYVVGARKKYYNPFNFFLITIAISAFLSAYFHLLSGGFRLVFFVLIFVIFVILFWQYYSLILYICFTIYILYVSWMVGRKTLVDHYKNFTFICIKSISDRQGDRYRLSYVFQEFALNSMIIVQITIINIIFF